ncbi:hypothetical protein WJX72_003225 [[Myrmecia] bisecta]|uniref:Uncharacterized protein n=1 Tax=[Myrmecia] bisecta TaxID=41462 RepID=A0AAW1QPT7_9CHLO
MLSDLRASPLSLCPIGSRACTNVSRQCKSFGRRPLRVQLVTLCEATGSKGFGRQPQPQKGKKAGGATPTKNKSGSKSKGKKALRVGPGPLNPPQDPGPQIPGQQAPAVDRRFRDKVSAKQEGREDPELAFQQRLKELELAAQRRKAEAAVARPANVLDSNSDIYANPPPLTQTLFSAASGDAAKAGSEAGGGSGLKNQIALAAGSLVLVAIFVLSSVVGDPSPRQRSSTASQGVMLGPEQIADVQKQAARFETTLASDATNEEALEGAAVSYATLGENAKAQALLERLVKAQPSNVDAWRLLAETRDQQLDYKGAVAAYQRAIAESPTGPNVDLLQGVAGALVGEGKPEKAVETIKAVQERSGQTSAAGTADIQPEEADLLLGRVYSQWRGHTAEALAVYNGMIEKYPNDFRGYLAKGILLRAEGQRGDAQRMFLQARYLAPPEARSAVEQVVNR